MAHGAPGVAYVDESRRGPHYLLACVIVPISHSTRIRSQVRALVDPPRQRIHFYNETPARRRQLLMTFDLLPIDVTVVRTRIGHGVGEHGARQTALTVIVRHLQERAVGRLVLESRDALDHEDRRHITRTRQPHSPLVYEHQHPADEPLLWLPDAYAWAIGARGPWPALIRRTSPQMITIVP